MKSFLATLLFAFYLTCHITAADNASVQYNTQQSDIVSNPANTEKNVTTEKSDAQQQSMDKKNNGDGSKKYFNKNDDETKLKNNKTETKFKNNNKALRQINSDGRNKYYGKDLEYPPAKRFLQTLSSEDKKKMRELYNNDPEKFRSIVKEKVNEFRKQEQLNSPSTIETVNKLKNAKNNDERKLYQAQIHEQTKKEFYERQEQSRIHLEDLEKKVKALRQIYEMRKNNADKIINDRVESISQDQSLDW
jgi:hypothetical protein